MAKPDPNAIPPNNKHLIAGAVLILLGSAWSLYEYNPGGMLRARTESEIKEEKEEAQLKKDIEKEKAAHANAK